jgi:RecA/RadA recombinase
VYSNNLLRELEAPLKNSITTVFGPAGVGKTTFAYLFAKEELLKGNKIFYVDSENGFSLKRFIQIFPEFKENKKLQESFVRVKVKSFEEQNNVLRNLNLTNASLIVDSISMLYRLELKDNFELINQELVKTLHILLEKVADQESKILLIAHSYFKDFEHRIVGGDILKYYSKVLIEFLFEGEKRKIKLLKHKYLPNKELRVEINEKGFKIKKFIF